MPLTQDEQAELDDLNSQASEPSQSRLSGPEQAELDNLNALAGLEPPAVTKGDQLFNRIQSGSTPSSLLPNALRMAAPLGLLAVTGPESALAASAIGALGGLVGEAGGQAVEISRGQRQSISPREILAGGVRNAIPVINETPISPLLKIPANALMQGAGAATADLIGGQGFNPMTSGAAALLGGGIPAAGETITRGSRGIGGTVQALRAGEDLIPALKIGGAQAFRPTVQTPIQQTALGVRRGITSRTMAPGQLPVDIPIALSEAISSPELTSQMRIPGAELTEDQLKGLSDTAFHFAVRTDRSDRSANKVAEDVWNILGNKRDEFNTATASAIEDLSNRATRAVNDADAAAMRQFSILYPGGRSRATIGNDIAALVDLAHQDAKRVWDDAYNSARSITDSAGNSLYNQVTIPADSIRDEARAFGMDFAKNSDGGISLIAAPPGLGRSVAGAAEISGPTAAPDLLTLDQARNLSSELSRNIRNAGVLPGVDTRFRVQLLSKVQDEIQNAVGAFPPLRDALNDANKIYRENIGRFKNSFTKGIMNDVGEKGGLLPEAIVTRLTGPNAESYLNSLEETVGAPVAGTTRVGTDLSNDARDLVREAFLSEARAAGTGLGEVDLGKAFDQIRKVPEPVRNRLFPNFGAMEAAAQKEKDIGAVTKALGDHNKLVTVPIADLQKAFGSKDAGDLMALAKNAVSMSEANAADLSRLSLDKLSQRGQFDVYKFITDERNSGKVASAMSFIDRSNPQLGNDVRALYLDNLIESASGAGKTDASAVAKALEQPNLKTATGQGGVGGTSRETAEAVLGKPAVDDLRSIAGLLKSLPKPENITLNEQRGFWHWLLLGNEGTSIASKTGKFGLGARLTSLAPALRYRLASKVLTDQDLRRAAMQATGTKLRDIVNRGLSMVTQDVARDFGYRSPQVQQLDQIRAGLINTTQ